jgi:hypothetical protein
VNKFPDFRAFISAYEAECVAITETRLNSEIPDSLFINTSQYHVYRKDRSSRGGGVRLLVKNNTELAVSLVDISSEFACLEMLAVDVGDSV